MTTLLPLGVYADKQTKRQVYIKISAKVEHVYHYRGTCSLYKFGYNYRGVPPKPLKPYPV